MKRLLLTLTLFSALLSARGQPYSYSYLTNLVRAELPMQTNRSIWPTNFYNVFDPILQSVILGPPWEFTDAASIDPSYGLKLDVVPAAQGWEMEMVWDNVGNYVRRSGKIPSGIGSATLSGGIYTVATTIPAYTSGTTYPDGMSVYVNVGTTSGGSEQLKWGTGPAKPIKLPDLTAIPVGDMVEDSKAHLVFSAGEDAWILQNPASGLAFDSTLYTAISGPTVTVGVPTNGLALNRLVQSAGSTLLGNPTGSTANVVPITLGANLSFSGSTLVATGGGGGSTGSPFLTATNYTIATNISSVFVNASSQNVTITLPAASLGQEVTITRADSTAHFVFVTPGGSDAIVGVPSPFPLHFQGDTVRLRGDGSSTNHYHLGGASWIMGNRSARRFTAVVGDEMYASSSTTGPTTWGQSVGGTGASGTVGITDYTANALYQGVFLFSTGSATNGFSALTQRATLLQLDANPVIAQVFVNIPTLSTDAEKFIFEVGLGDAAAVTDDTDVDAVLVRYTHTENSGKFRVRVNAASAGSSYTDAQVTVVAATWYRITILASSSSCVVDINGTITGPITTGLPSGSSQALTYKTQLLKAGGSTGVNPRTAYVDRWDGSKFGIK